MFFIMLLMILLGHYNHNCQIVVNMITQIFEENNKRKNIIFDFIYE